MIVQRTICIAQLATILLVASVAAAHFDDSSNQSTNQPLGPTSCSTDSECSIEKWQACNAITSQCQCLINYEYNATIGECVECNAADRMCGGKLERVVYVPIYYYNMAHPALTPLQYGMVISAIISLCIIAVVYTTVVAIQKKRAMRSDLTTVIVAQPNRTPYSNDTLRMPTDVTAVSKPVSYVYDNPPPSYTECVPAERLHTSSAHRQQAFV